MKRLMAAAALAAGVLLAAPASVGAFITYCDWDPIVLIITPAGALVPVYDSVWTSSPVDVGLPVESYSATRVYVAGKPETAVDMAIAVPTGLLLRYSVSDAVTTGLLGSGTVLARANGTSGQTVHLKFTLPQA